MNSVNGIGVQIKVRVHGLAGHPFKGLLLHVPNGQTVEALQAASLHVQFIWSFGPPSHTKANGHSTESWVCSFPGRARILQGCVPCAARTAGQAARKAARLN